MTILQCPVILFVQEFVKNNLLYAVWSALIARVFLDHHYNCAICAVSENQSRPELNNLFLTILVDFFEKSERSNRCHFTHLMFLALEYASKIPTGACKQWLNEREGTNLLAKWITSAHSLLVE